jgi:hypothetical protein
MYVSGNNEALTSNHCCSKKAIIIIHSDCVFVALFIQYSKRMHLIYCSLWSVRLYHIFHNFRGEKKL